MRTNEAQGMPEHTPYHPRWYRTRVSTYWWLHQWSYFMFVLRELTSLAVAFFVVMTLLQVRALSHGPQAYAGFARRLTSPLLLTLNLISFFLLLLHTITWFNLAPRAMVVRVGGKRVPEVVITTTNYILWFAISGIVAWAFLRG